MVQEGTEAMQLFMQLVSLPPRIRAMAAAVLAQNHTTAVLAEMVVPEL
jgi:hypothetical protein